MLTRVSVGRFGWLLAAAMPLCTLSPAASAQDDDEPSEQRYYIVPGGTFYVADRDRGSEDGSGFTFGVGKRFGSNVAVELKYFEVNLDGRSDFSQDGAEFEGDGYGLDVYLFGANYKEWNPYLVIGVAYADIEIDAPALGGETNSDFLTGGIGLGVQSQITERGTSFRFDVRYQHSEAQDDIEDELMGLEEDFNDIVFNLGLLVPLGARQAEADSRPLPPDPYDKRFYLVGGANYNRFDRDRLIDDQFGGRFAIGRQYRNKTALEFRVDQVDAGNQDIDGRDLDANLKLTNVGLDLIFHREVNNTLRPYFVFGLGYQKTELECDSDCGLLSGDLTNTVAPFETEYSSATLDFGFGIQTIPNASLVGLRFDVRNRHEFVNEQNRDPVNERDFDDLVMNLSAVVPLGRNPYLEEPPAPEIELTEVVQTDTDGDTVFDPQDKCPNTKPGVEVDQFGCERDDDNDGVPNSIDQCPNSPPGAEVDETGCTPIADVVVLEGVNFATDSARLTENAKTILDDVAQTLRVRPNIKVEVGGHTDWVGAATYNEALSARRARSVADYLISAGVDEDNVTARGFGESQPIADNNTAAGRSKNRRVELKVLSR